MDWYLIVVVLHVLAALLWFGHMFFWSLVAGFATKGIEPPDVAAKVRKIGLRGGGFGWPALGVLFATGIVIVAHSGISVRHVATGEFLGDPVGRVMALKIALVGCMVLYQWRVGHRPAPRLIYLNMLVALAVIVLSILRVRPPWQ